MRGIVVGVPGLNAVAIPLDQREYIDGVDLNRVFPGRIEGGVSEQYVSIGRSTGSFAISTI